MRLTGMGLVCARGRGIAALEQALRDGWAPPSVGPAGPLYAVDDASVAEQTIGRKLRRADRLARMAAVAAYDAWQDAALDAGAATRTGVIVGTAFGPHVTTFRFLDDILEYGDAGVSPTVFSHSVHNAAASYIATVLGIRGPATTVTQFCFSFHQALLLAGAWLAQGRCEHVLVGGVDEAGAVMEYAFSRRLAPAPDGRLQPLRLGRSPVAVPAEGAVFFVVSRAAGGSAYADVRVGPAAVADVPDLRIIHSDGMIGDERRYLAAVREDRAVAAYCPLFGSMMIGTAFDCAAAALMLKRQCRYATPATDNPHSLPVDAQAGPAALRSICCTKYDCSGKRMDIALARA
jgi:3-oxoacyl-[acyl-carrier-protein] synthase II